MDLTHLHLVINHIPMFATLFGIGLFAAGYFRKSDELKKTGLLLFVLSGIAMVVTYLTGESAEETVEHLPGVIEAVVEKHEDVAKFAAFITEVLGVAGLGGLILYYTRKSIPTWFVATVLGLSVLSAGAIAATANLGGKIRHTEIAGGSSGTNVTQDFQSENDDD